MNKCETITSEEQEGEEEYLKGALQRFNKIAIQGKGPDGKWARKPLAYRESNIFSPCVMRPPEICVNLVFKHIHAASSYTICK